MFRAILDCGDRPGDVLAALRQGLSDLAFHGDGPVRDRLAAIAGAKGARLLRRPREDLDCARTPDPATACKGLIFPRPC